MRLICGEPEERGQPCRTKIGGIFKGDARHGPLVQTFIADPQDVTGSDRDGDILPQTGEHDTAVLVWFLDDDGSAGCRGLYTTRCVRHHRHALDDRGRHRLQAATRQGLMEVVFTSTEASAGAAVNGGNQQTSSILMSQTGWVAAYPPGYAGTERHRLGGPVLSRVRGLVRR